MLVCESDTQSDRNEFMNEWKQQNLKHSRRAHTYKISHKLNVTRKYVWICSLGVQTISFYYHYQIIHLAVFLSNIIFIDNQIGLSALSEILTQISSSMWHAFIFCFVWFCFVSNSSIRQGFFEQTFFYRYFNLFIQLGACKFFFVIFFLFVQFKWAKTY